MQIAIKNGKPMPNVVLWIPAFSLPYNLDSVELKVQLAHMDILKITSHQPLHAITQYELFSLTRKRYKALYGDNHILQQLSFHGMRGNMGVFNNFFLSNSTYWVKLASLNFIISLIWRCNTRHCAQHHIILSCHKQLNFYHQASDPPCM